MDPRMIQREPRKCECGRKVDFYVQVTDGDGILLDRVGFCGVCFGSPSLQKPVKELDLSVPVKAAREY